MTPCHQNFTKVPSIPDANRHSPHPHRRGSVYLAWHRWQRSWYCGWLQRIIPGTGTHFRPRKGGGNKGGFKIWEVDWVHEWWRILVWNLKSWPTKICLLLMGVRIVTIVNHPPRLTRTFPAIFQLRGPAEASDVRISSIQTHLKRCSNLLESTPPWEFFVVALVTLHGWNLCASSEISSHRASPRLTTPSSISLIFFPFGLGWLSWLVDPRRIPFLMPFGKKKPNAQDEKIHCTPASHVSSLEN